MAVSTIIKKYSNNSEYIVNVYQFNSPIGKILSVADENFLYMLAFYDSKNIEKMIKSVAQELNCKFTEGKNKIIENLEEELESYFNGNLKKFTVPIKTIGSEFQKEVWNKMLEMPYGSTQTYGDLAKLLGRSSSHSRAIGAACGANAHIVLIPCHRIVATGSKGGFSSGKDRKEWLLNHEKKHTT